MTSEGRDLNQLRKELRRAMKRHARRLDLSVLHVQGVPVDRIPDSCLRPVIGRCLELIADRQTEVLRLRQLIHTRERLHAACESNTI